MRTTTLMLAAAAATIGVLVPVADAQDGTATTACLDCTSFDQQQCEATRTLTRARLRRRVSMYQLRMGKGHWSPTTYA